MLSIPSAALTATGAASVLVSDQPTPASIAAAALPNGIVIAYDRVDASSGSVGRVFTRIYPDPPRRHAAHP